jgi:co-chaperonin GroES (HSP10)
MKAINEFIIIDKIEEEVRTDSGLILSGEDVNQMRYAKGKIKTVGDKVTQVNPEDVIYYDKRSAYDVVLSGQPVTVIQLKDVVIVL